MAFAFKAYGTLLQKRPMLGQCTTAAVLFGAGDVLAQQAVEKRGADHDFMRTARTSFYGGAVFGPAITKWFQFLNRIKFPSPIKAVMYRVLLDQGVCTPIAVAVFFGSMTILEGKSFQDAQKRISDSYIPTLVANWSVFIPVQAINFALIPPHLRFALVSVVSLFWNAYLSAANAQSKKSPAEKLVENVVPSDEKKLLENLKVQ